MIPILELWSILITHLKLQNKTFLVFRAWLINALWNGDKIMCREKWTMLELENSKERSGKCLLGEKNLLLKSPLHCNLSAILSLICLHQPTQHGNEEESLNVGWEEDGLAWVCSLRWSSLDISELNPGSGFLTWLAFLMISSPTLQFCHPCTLSTNIFSLRYVSLKLYPLKYHSM